VSGARAGERGLTLTEVTVTMVLAAIVMTGLVGFYLSSQATWLDGSLQAITQREATLVIETIRRRVQTANQAVSAPVDGGAHWELVIVQKPGDPGYYYWWSAADSLIHEGFRDQGDDRGPMLSSKVDRFVVSTSNNFQLVRIVSLQVRTPNGHDVTLSSSIRLANAN
jgi:prepilin-type N-terminal cleavage/methylation domain-containing protein